MEYKTIQNESIYEETEKRSKFISYSFKVFTSEEAQRKLKEVKSIHKTAKHWVYAYIVNEGQEEKYCDDGEPSGTSGMPTMGAIKSLELQKVMVVTVRYFGGILLGTAGLRKMYASTALGVLERSGIVEMKKVSEVSVVCSYNQYGKITKILSEFESKIKKLEYGSEVSFTFLVNQKFKDAVVAKIVDILRNDSGIKVLSDTFASI